MHFKADSSSAIRMPQTRQISTDSHTDDRKEKKHGLLVFSDVSGYPSAGS
jgi:hypothetical protein